MVNHYLPMKILDREFADRLMGGEVYMRQMREFGSWNNPMTANEYQDRSLKEGMRTDFHEGASYVVQKGEYDPYGFVKGLSDGIRNRIQHVVMVDEKQKYTRLFCMTKLDYDCEKNSFISLDSRLKELGDTAVIILNPQEFYRRIQETYSRKYANLYVLSAGVVDYNNVFGQSMEWEVFKKSDRYRWQNEVRIVACLRDDIYIQNELEMESDPVINIKNISDIAVEISLDDLLKHKYPQELYSEEVKDLLYRENGAPLGLTESGVSVSGEFRTITPDRDWIECLQNALPDNLWSPITYMECIRPGGKPIPRLMFAHKEKRCFVRFGFSEILFLSEEAEMIECEFPQGVINTCIVKSGLPLQGIALSGIYNMGDVSGKYIQYNDIGLRKQIIEDGLLFSENLRTCKINERNVFGAYNTDTKWQYCVTADTSPSWQFACQSLEQILSRYTKMAEIVKRKQRFLEGDDMYGQFCNL